MSIRFCHDCEHTFVEFVDIAEGGELCPFCEGGNWDEYDEDEEGDPDEGVDSFKEGHEGGR